jgi:arylsulfatase A-like enzyme
MRQHREGARGILALIALSAGALMGQEVSPKPNWPQPPHPPKGAPNIVLILLDDVGFGATSTFGGPAATPELDKLASSGLRYNRFHVNAMCSPTRGSLLSGRNSHGIGFGMIAESAAGYPGYNSLWPKSAAPVAEILKQNGYSTAAFGKWHNTPVWDVNPAGPFDRWPIGLGFEYFYGFLGAATSQWEPNLYRNVAPVEAPAKPAAGYHLTTDLVNDAIGWVQKHDAITPDKPFFLYFATGATHAPHHVPKEWIAKYKGKFDQGWDKIREQEFARQKELGVIPVNAELTPRPKEIAAWDSLSVAQKQLLAHQMEVYAGFLAHTDHEIGRLLAAIKAEGHNEDTVVLYIAGDNGASAEGGFEGRDAVGVDGRPLSVDERLQQSDRLGSEYFTNMYATAWGWSLNSPFQWAKEVASHLGGTRDPLIVSWPGHIKDEGGLRSQFHHVNDIAPTLLDLAGIKAPQTVNGVKQVPFEGTSIAYTFDHPNEPSHHHVQYFEMLGSRGIYKDGWWAGSFKHLPWQYIPASGGAMNDRRTQESQPWELYNLNEDYSQAHNLAAKYPEKVKELVALFDSEARRNNVYPLEPQRGQQPSPAAGKTTFTYHSGIQRIPAASAPRLAGRTHRITADLDIPAKGATGVIIAQGGRLGGFSLYVKDGRVVYEANAFGHKTGEIVSAPLPAGKVHVVLDFVSNRSDLTNPLAARMSVPGTAALTLNGQPAGKSQVAGLVSTGETLDIGSDQGSPVSSSYESPFAFSGKIVAVTVDLL